MNACAEKDTKGHTLTTSRFSSSCKFAYYHATSQAGCYGWTWVVVNAHNIKKHGSFGWHDKCANRWKAPCVYSTSWASFGSMASLSLGASNGAETASPSTVHTTHMDHERDPSPTLVYPMKHGRILLCTRILQNRRQNQWYKLLYFYPWLCDLTSVWILLCISGRAMYLGWLT